MPNFDIKSQERFPDSVSGHLAPDDGVKRHFNDSVSEFYGSGYAVVALFVSEYTTRLQEEFLRVCVEEGPDYDISLSGIVTFGAHRDLSKLGSTHLDIIARELAIPLLRLEKPVEFPDFDSSDPEPYMAGWIGNNPLLDLYFDSVQIETRASTASICAIPSDFSSASS